MGRKDDWKPFSWYCLNCGKIVTGYKNPKGDIKVQCLSCGVVMVRSLKTPKHDVVEVFAPEGQVRIESYST